MQKQPCRCNDDRLLVQETGSHPFGTLPPRDQRICERAAPKACFDLLERVPRTGLKPIALQSSPIGSIWDGAPLEITEIVDGDATSGWS
jgi:hypothetical protein